ncbi:hypothetical protein Hypma_009874 [Hypsizygus marmoreus]|uniref:Uncharacterized protein n=1 Tax=Hypsizygus marmoreus TaxID=39966 RepID=A0A369JUQ9_HYPMA|nr:hypothetical protein Hypma_009874 [Hypsizygus marmoreus]
MKTQDIPPWRPFAFKAADNVTKNLCTYEWMLRDGEAYDALKEIRHVLRLRSHLLKNKDRRCPSQHTIQCGHSECRCKNPLHGKHITRDSRGAGSFRMGWSSSCWESSLRVLERDDIRGLSDQLFGETEGTAAAAQDMVKRWGIQTEDLALNDGECCMDEGFDILLTRYSIALRIEWCQARAKGCIGMRRSSCWRRCPEHAHVCGRHRGRKRGVEHVLMHMRRYLQEGRLAYARRQASLSCSLRERFIHERRDLRVLIQKGVKS